MAGLKEIKSRIKSVKNTQKITYAMKLVSATKLRKAQSAVELSREYTNALSALVGRIALEQRDVDFQHPLFEERDSVRRVALIVVGGNRGLCGAYNANVNRAVDAFFKEHAGTDVQAIVLGKKPCEHFKKRHLPVQQAFDELSDDPNTWPLQDIMDQVEDSFVSGDVDAVYVIYTRFISALTMTVETDRFLPVDAEALIAEAEEPGETASAGVLFEPSPEEVFASIVPRIVRGKLRQVCLETKASEQGSRMTAMDSATKNASDLIESLTRTYNRLRQSGITAEILDIIGGAEGIK